METERYDIIEGPGRPSICLGMARGDWFTTCCTAQDFSLDITGQTRDIFDVFDRHMAEAGTDISEGSVRAVLAQAHVGLRRRQCRLGGLDRR